MRTSDFTVREIFVTVGATASFDELIERVLTIDFLDTAKELRFNKITIQCGKSYPKFKKYMTEKDKAFEISVFDFNEQGLGQEMRGTTAGAGRVPGVIISHAGSGSILDAMRLGCNIIVVPNETLLDNHQAELADELEAQGYVTKGDIPNLSNALRRCATDVAIPPSYIWPQRGTGNNLASIIDETVSREEATRSHLD
ncbi:glycosyltransferase family 28 domain-containing protein [Phlyctema vagabunda]|uniref:UDP-N-acetylglucosamine transferase subunit ALG13 n=1 Tax=Phlyctema vagabunda TaxID=108571 RepID=A0ABR4PLU5_9HELO